MKYTKCSTTKKLHKAKQDRMQDRIEAIAYNFALVGHWIIYQNYGIFKVRLSDIQNNR